MPLTRISFLCTFTLTMINSFPIYRIFQHSGCESGMQNNVEGLQLEEEKAQHEKEESVRLAKETAYEPHKMSSETQYLKPIEGAGKSSLATKQDSYPNVRSLFLTNNIS